jgi:hypothetical protein
VRRAQDHPHVVMLARGTRCQLQTILPSVCGRRRQSACMGWGRPGVEGLLGRRRLKPVHVLARTGWTARVVTIRHAILRAGYATERCNHWTINRLADSVALSCPRCYAKAAGANARRGAAPQVDCRSMHTLHAALCMRIADTLKAVARVGSPRLVAYGDLVFGGITVLMSQLSPSPSWPGSTACRARWYVTVADRVLDMRRASPDGSRRATSQARPRLAPAVLTPG